MEELFHKEYIEELWFLLHYSDDPNKKTFAFTCYLDESGIDNQGPVAVVGGLIMNKTISLHFDEQWACLLDHYGIKQPLHMKTFRNDNKHLSARSKRGFFLGLVDLINSHKYVSIASTINHEQFKTMMHDAISEHVGMYFFCFLGCAFLNHMQADYMKYNERIAFLLERPSEHGDEILAAHKTMINYQKTKEFHMGTLGFADKNVSLLQAADVIVWGVRRHISKRSFPAGFEPVLEIFKTDHLEDEWKDKEFIALAKWATEEVAKEIALKRPN